MQAKSESESLNSFSLREFREEHGYTQQELANLLGVARNYVYLIESGAKPLSAKIRRKIAQLIENSEKRLECAQSEQNQPQVDTPRGGAAGLEARLSAVEERLAAVERLLLRLAADADAGRPGSSGK